ncbi:MAG: hypothetical protein ACI90V_001607 [Bacillariaceae sp.]|jgi:hypothetical protein
MKATMHNRSKKRNLFVWCQLKRGNNFGGGEGKGKKEEKTKRKREKEEEEKKGEKQGERFILFKGYIVHSSSCETNWILECGSKIGVTSE